MMQVFKPKIANFVATSNQCKLWCTARILCFKFSKETVQIFQRNCIISAATSYNS